jgi:hypothetical protein
MWGWEQLTAGEKVLVHEKQPVHQILQRTADWTL